jgi:hypothetical protein
MIQLQDVGLATDEAQPSTARARDVDTEARRALWGSALGYAMDGFDLLILGFMSSTKRTALGRACSSDRQRR